MSQIDDAARLIADAIGKQEPTTSARWRWGTVESVNAGGTMNVNVGGVTMPGIRALTSALGAKVGDRVRIDYLGTDAVVAGVRATDGYPPNFRDLGRNPITTTTDDTTANWSALGNGFAFYSGTGQLNGQPGQYGCLINHASTSTQDVFQLWHEQRDGALFVRGGNQNGWADWHGIAYDMRTWGTIAINSSNCSSLGTSWLLKRGNEVTVSFIDAALKSALANNGNVFIATLPSGYRPPANVYSCCLEAAGLWARIDSNGAVRISNRTGASYAADKTASFTLTYVL